MLGKRIVRRDTTSHIPNGDSPLVLQPKDQSELCHFPIEVLESHRHIITRMMNNGSMPDRLSVVSAFRGEGVTFSSLAMATTLSHDFSHSVCYVELNWMWPAPQLAPFRDSSDGIAGILNNSIEPEDALIPTECANFYLLPAGRIVPEQRHMMARSSALKDVLTQLGDRFDFLVLDTPAILATSDAIALASHGDTAIMIIRQGAGNTAAIKRALDDISHMTIQGVVLNRVRIATPAWLRNWIPGA